MSEKDSCCCVPKPVLPPDPDQAGWVAGMVDSKTGPIPQLSTDIHWADRIGALKVRLGYRRMDYGVAPGLYAVGNPVCGSPFLVTANYKLTIDTLRKNLAGYDFWILVLDTHCVNVWCAAGKHTFSTEELIYRLYETRAEAVSCMKLLILPQLGAPGICAQTVKRETGFTVQYGPIRAEDLPAFLDNAMKADAEMRQVRFDTHDRMLLAPLDMVLSSKLMLVFALCALAIQLILFLSGKGGVPLWQPPLVMLTCWFVTGLFFPLAMPVLPGRAFAVKGIWIALAMVLVATVFGGLSWDSLASVLVSLGASAIAIAYCSFLAMNFTGTSTFTSQSGAMLEVKYAVPLQIGIGVIGIIFWVGGEFLKGGIV